MRIDASDIARARKEVLRRAILLLLDAGRPIATSRTLLHRAIDGAQEIGSVDLREIAAEIDYLKGKDLVRYPEDSDKLVQLTPTGVDVIEGTVPTPVGIAKVHTTEG